MLIASLGLGEEINNLDLDGKVVEGDSLVTNRTPSEIGHPHQYAWSTHAWWDQLQPEEPQCCHSEGEWERRWSHQDPTGANGAR